MKAARSRASHKGQSSGRETTSVAERAAQEIERLRRENERLREENAEQAKQIADLERQLALRQQNSTTSSKPPSSDGLAGRPRERGRRTKSRRTPGGQPGHPGHCRSLMPAARVNQVIDVFPAVCRHCDHALSARRRVVTGEPRRHQVTELPPIEAHVTEYRCVSVVCPACHKTTQGQQYSVMSASMAGSSVT